MRAGLIFLVGTLVLLAGAQAAYGCDEPAMKKFPSRGAGVGDKVKVVVTGVTPGTEYLLNVDGADRDANVTQTNRLALSFDMLDGGTDPRRMWVTVVLNNDQCENAPWKLTRTIHYTGNGLPPATSPAAGNPAKANQTPSGAPTPAPAAAVPVVKLPKIPKPKPPLKIPSQPPANSRIWATGTDQSARISDNPKQPKLPRSAVPVDEANSTHALVGLGVLFVLIAIATAAALILLNRKDRSLNTDEEDGRLPTHLDVSDITAAGNAAPGTAGATTAASDPQAAAGSAIRTLPDGAVQEKQPGEAPGLVAAASAAEAAGGNGHGDQVNGNGAVAAKQPAPTPEGHFDALFQSMLEDDDVEQELRGIVAEAREQAELQGVAVDRDQIIQALAHLTSRAQALSVDARAKLLSRFEQIVSEELDRVPQVHS